MQELYSLDLQVEYSRRYTRFVFNLSITKGASMERIGGETMVLYADLKERLDIFEAMRSLGVVQGN